MRTDDDEERHDEPPDEIGAEVPEADAIEQRLPAVGEDEDDGLDTIPPDVPEADALDQAKDVPVDDEAGR